MSLRADTTFAHPAKAGHTVVADVIEGEGYFDPGRDPFARQAVGENYFDMARPCACGEGALVLYGPGDRSVVTTEKRTVRFLLVAGRPLEERIAWYGPIVLSTQEELRTAFREYEPGAFVKARPAVGFRAAWPTDSPTHGRAKDTPATGGVRAPLVRVLILRFGP